MELLVSFFRCSCITRFTYMHIQQAAASDLTREASSSKVVLHKSLFTYCGLKVPTPNCSLHAAFAHMILYWRTESHVNSNGGYSIRLRRIHLPLKSHDVWPALWQTRVETLNLLLACVALHCLCVLEALPHHFPTPMRWPLKRNTTCAQCVILTIMEQRHRQSMECPAVQWTG